MVAHRDVYGVLGNRARDCCDNPSRVHDCCPAGLLLISATATIGTAVATIARTPSRERLPSTGGDFTIPSMPRSLRLPRYEISNRIAVYVDDDGTNYSIVLTTPPPWSSDPTFFSVEGALVRTRPTAADNRLAVRSRTPGSHQQRNLAAGDNTGDEFTDCAFVSAPCHASQPANGNASFAPAGTEWVDAPAGTVTFCNPSPLTSNPGTLSPHRNQALSPRQQRRLNERTTVLRRSGGCWSSDPPGFVVVALVTATADVSGTFLFAALSPTHRRTNTDLHLCGQPRKRLLRSACALALVIASQHRAATARSREHVP